MMKNKQTTNIQRTRSALTALILSLMLAACGGGGNNGGGGSSPMPGSGNR